MQADDMRKLAATAPRPIQRHIEDSPSGKIAPLPSLGGTPCCSWDGGGGNCRFGPFGAYPTRSLA